VTSIRAQGTLLTANAETRTLEYLLLPYGEEGNTSAGKVTASAGTLTIPESMHANMEHDRTRPVATSTYIREEEDGIRAGFRVVATTAGNDLLVEAAEGLRTGISVEVDNPVIRAGALIGGDLTGAGFVTTPAFPSAQLAAADAGDLPGEDPEDPALDPEDDDAADAADEEGGDVPPETSTIPAPVTAARAPMGLPSAGATTPNIGSAQDLFERLAAAHSAMDGGRLLAALDNAIQADVESAVPTQWIDEVWASRTHRQKFVPLFTRAPLTALKMVGWRFARDETTGALLAPTVDNYTGFPAQPTSTDVRTEPVEISAERVAGANAVDRAFIDFSSPSFWSGFYREQANDVSRKMDIKALVEMSTPANYTAVAGDTVPADVSPAAAAIVDGVIAIQDVATPDFAVIGVDLWREFVLTKHSDALEYLSVAVGLDPAEGRFDTFKFVPSSAAAFAGKVLVGASEAHTFYGEKSVRVDTVNVSTGGVETGLFAYVAKHTADALAFALVTPPA
jgi:hypothetical protein